MATNKKFEKAASKAHSVATKQSRTHVTIAKGEEEGTFVKCTVERAVTAQLTTTEGGVFHKGARIA